MAKSLRNRLIAVGGVVFILGLFFAALAGWLPEPAKKPIIPIEIPSPNGIELSHPAPLEEIQK
jgi:hypothetical protein